MIMFVSYHNAFSGARVRVGENECVGVPALVMRSAYDRDIYTRSLPLVNVFHHTGADYIWISFGVQASGRNNSQNTSDI